MSNLSNKQVHRRDFVLNEQNYRVEDSITLLNNLQQIVFQLDISGRWVFLNSAWKYLTNYSIEESLDTHFMEYVHPKDRTKVDEYLQNLLRQESVSHNSVNTRILSERNKYMWMVLRANPIYDDNARDVNGIIGTLTEITEKKREQELLEAKFRSLRNLVNNHPGMIYRCRNDQNLTLEYVSNGCFELTGYNHDQLIQNNEVTYTNIIHPDDRQHVLEAVLYNLNDGDHYELTHRIITASGKTQWVLNRGKGNFSSSGELLSFEGILFNFYNQREVQKRILKLTLYDPDSKLLNKDLFMNRLEHALQKTKSRDNYVFSILLLNIDQYSQILENLGADYYESVISEIGRRISETLEPSTSLCRLQEDQLGILLDSSEYSIKNITAIMSQIQAQVQAPMSIAENELYVTASIGVVIGNSKYTDKDKVFSDAQDALNRAKSLGGARYELSDLVTHGKAALQAHIETELEQTLNKDKFLVYWQPILGLQDDKLKGLEARLVWPHPLRGLLFADQFVPSAEETQLITPLWEWMLNDTSRQIENWKISIDEINKISLNIQVTGATLLDADSILRLREKLLKVKPELCNLVVGVSEDVLLHAPGTTAKLLKPIKGKDIQLLLDSYGAEKTNLELLREMPIDVIRLDSGLIEKCVEDQGSLIRAISSLAHELKILVIANNVQNDEQIKILKKSKVDFAQGAGISKPIDEDAAIEMLNSMSII